ncbi:MAG: hypothetical protein RIR73_1782 [Chloroflexota bacterium]
MIRRNSGADSIVWIEEGTQHKSVWDFVWIHAPKTFTVFGILFNGFTRLISGFMPVFTPRSFNYAEAFLFVGMTLAVI